MNIPSFSLTRADDEPFVWKLHNDLKTLGIETWYDREHMTADGSPFTQAIGDAIRQMLKGQVLDEVIEQLITLLAGSV